VRVLYGRAFINITITMLCKPMTSQFSDRLVFGYGKMMTGLKKHLSYTTLVLMHMFACSGFVHVNVMKHWNVCSVL